MSRIATTRATAHRRTRSAHFWKAAHELLAAARVVIDAADALVDEQMRPKPEAQPRVRRIDVDER